MTTSKNNWCDGASRSPDAITPLCFVVSFARAIFAVRGLNRLIPEQDWARKKNLLCGHSRQRRLPHGDFEHLMTQQESAHYCFY
ncbi:hypothetical protein [Caballeronia sp. DA-9]|uniref:hypothetical protein n=1 Tax=Caballeronia sp. DA-9 TaxID=3436237 RepID=UPI003F675CD7